MKTKKDLEYSVFYEISSFPTRLETQKEILDLARDMAGRLLESDVCVLYLLDMGKDRLHAKAALGVSLTQVLEYMPVIDGEINLGLEIIECGPESPLTLPHDPLLGQYQVQEAIGAPISSNGELLGWMYAARGISGPFTDTEKSLFSVLADRIGSALVNLREIEQAKRQNLHLQTANEVSRIISSALDLKEMIGRVAQAVHQGLGYYHTGVFLIDNTGAWAVLEAAAGEADRQMLSDEFKLPVGQAGLVGYVTERGEARVAQDVSLDPLHYQQPRLPDTQSEAVVPLRIGKRILGALDVQSIEQFAFTEEDVCLLQSLADQLAVAIENANLFSQHQVAMQELGSTLETDRRTYGDMSRDAWNKLLGSRTELSFICDSQDTVFPSGPGIKPEINLANQTGNNVLTEEGVLAIPVKIRDQVIGVVRLQKPDDKAEWSKEEVELMEALTDQLGMALESARLYEDTQRRAERERLISDITTKVRASTNLDVIMQTAVQELAEALNISRGSIQLRGDGGDHSDE